MSDDDLQAMSEADFDEAFSAGDPAQIVHISNLYPDTNAQSRCCAGH